LAHTPDDPTKPQVWVEKGLDELDFEFYIPQGPKGDPGGFVSTGITTTLNDYVTPGTYHVSAASDSANALALNMPYNEAATLLVTSSNANSTTTIQTFITNTKGIYKRRKFGSTWSAWIHFGSTRTDQTAGRAMYQWDELNQREQLVWGDTGVRDISSLLVNGWVLPASGTLFIRRVGSVVTMWGMIDGTNFTTDHFYTPPAAGFAPETSGGSYAPVVSSDYADVRDIAYDGTFYIRSATKKIWRVRATWTTIQPWPTTLPGSGSFIANN